jgi:uncharacterized HAD superfamily protein
MRRGFCGNGRPRGYGTPSSGRRHSRKKVSLEWLARRHRVPFETFTMVDKYGRFATDDTVAITLNEFSARRFCWAVEDSLPMAQYLASQMAVPVALIDCPWNRADAEHSGIARYSAWSEIAATLPNGGPQFNLKKNR